MKHIVSIMLCVVGIIAILAISAREQAARRMEVQPQDDTVVTDTSSIIARCETMDGGKATDCLQAFDGGPHLKSSDFLLENDSSTCVRVGSDSSVDNNHGARVGSGCPQGTTYAAHAAQCFCESEGARQMVGVNRGHP